MVDFHTHILPGIDDGSESIHMTGEMLKEELHQGVDCVVATPHFYPDRISVRRFLEEREKAYGLVLSLKDQLSPGSLPGILLGAEVYYFPGMGAADQLPLLAVGNTRTILLEMPFGQWTDDVYKDVREIIEKQGLKVVLAHVERYTDLQRDRSVWRKVMSLPVVPQINSGSFLHHKTGLFRKDRRREFSLDFLRRHGRLILGSDCHNLTSRRPNLAAGRAAIETELGRDALKMIDSVTSEVLR